jgi:hypothetical protein
VLWLIEINRKVRRVASRIILRPKLTHSLRLIAAPNPKDDLTDDEIALVVKRSEHSSELITQLIDYIKNL